jgi:hypothetical protein
MRHANAAGRLTENPATHTDSCPGMYPNVLELGNIMAVLRGACQGLHPSPARSRDHVPARTTYVLHAHQQHSFSSLIMFVLLCYSQGVPRSSFKLADRKNGKVCSAAAATALQVMFTFPSLVPARASPSSPLPVP